MVSQIMNALIPSIQLPSKEYNKPLNFSRVSCLYYPAVQTTGDNDDD